LENSSSIGNKGVIIGKFSPIFIFLYLIFQMDVYEILNNHKEDIEEIKKKLNRKSEELDNLKSKYQFMLEKLLEMTSKPIKKEKPIAVQNLSLGSNQLIFLLKKGQATRKEFSVSAIQLKAAFNLSKSERTIRNKLNELEITGHVSSIDGRPKKYFLNEFGINYIQKQSKDVLNQY